MAEYLSKEELNHGICSIDICNLKKNFGIETGDITKGFSIDWIVSASFGGVNRGWSSIEMKWLCWKIFELIE